MTPRQRPRDSQSTDSASFLVRMWREPRADGEGPLRVFLRNLSTGEELYLGNPARVGEILDVEAEVVGQPAELEVHGSKA